MKIIDRHLELLCAVYNREIKHWAIFYESFDRFADEFSCTTIPSDCGNFG
jgi:hypothetical protein